MIRVPLPLLLPAITRSERLGIFAAEAPQAVSGDAASIAAGGDRAAVAMRVAGRAAGLAEGNEVGVPGDPVAYRQQGPQGHLRVVRGFRVDETEPVRDAVNVDVDADGWLVEAERDDKVRCFSPYAGQFTEGFDGIGEDAAELRVQHVGQSFQVASLVTEETDGIYGPLEFVERNLAQVLRRCDTRKKPSTRCGGAGVFRTRAQNGTEQHTERIACLNSDEVDNRSLRTVEGGLELAVNCRKIRRFHK